MLGAIWGASFLFVRIVAPVLGPVATADSRMLVAGIALALWFRLTGFDAQRLSDGNKVRFQRSSVARRRWR